MTKKDYIVIAAALKAGRSKEETIWGDEVNEAMDVLALIFVEKLAADNPRFNRDRFLQACGAQ